MILVRPEFHLSDFWHQLIVASTVFSAFAFAIVAGDLSGKFGRRPTILCASVAFTVGAFVMGLAAGKYMLLLGRIIVGIGIGLSSMAVPVYISEACPAPLRGRMTLINQAFLTGGQFAASIICGIFSYADEGWRYMFGLSAIPAVIQFFGFVAMPESPRYLVHKGKYSEALDVLKRIRNPHDAISEELEEMRVSANRNSTSNEATFRQIWRHKQVRKALIVGSALQLFQQLSGINTVMYYSTSIVQMAGFADTSKSIWLASTTAAVNFGCTFIGMHYVDKSGRRPLLFASLAGVTLSLAFLSGSFALMSANDPTSANYDATAPLLPCDEFSTCSTCIVRSEGSCGFCLDNLKGSGSCFAASGNSSSTCQSSGEDSKWYHAASCPNWVSYLPVLGICLYVFSFAPGMGPLPWTINAEIYPMWARSKCTGITTAVNWMSNLFVSMTFLTIVSAMGESGAFLFYTILAAAGLAFFFVFLPETRGISLEETETLFSAELRTPDRAKGIPYARIAGSSVFEND